MSSTGTANYEIPLTLPPGTNGLTPSLSLLYDHNQGNGLLGVGWTISGLSGITRCNKTIAQDGAAGSPTLAVSDGYCLDGNRLRLTGGTYGTAGSTYQTELETFARVTAQGTAGNGPASWEVRGKDGLIYEYGNTTDSRIETVGSTTARYWALNKIRDRVGNYIEFVYTEDTTNGSFRPSEIRYTGHATLGTAPATKVVFVYEAVNRPDPIYTYRFGTPAPGGQIDEYKRLDRIDVQHIASATIVRTYELTYETGGGAGGRSRLDTLQECRAGDCFPATDLTWISGTSSWASAEGSNGQSVPTAVNALVGDIDGDGRDDLVWSSSTTSGSGSWYYMRGTSGGYGAAVSTGITNWNYTHAQAIEWDGDGRMDVLVPCNGTGTWCVLQANGSGLSGPIDTGTPSTGFDNQVLAADIDGDGRDDLVRIMNTTSLGLRLRLAGGFGAETTAYSTIGDPNNWLNGNFAELRAMKFRSLGRRMDFNGDGRDDFVLKMKYDEGPGGNVFHYVATFLGSGSTLTRGGNVGTTVLPWLAGDFNGDGLTDLFFFAATNYARMAKGAGGFSANVAGPPVSAGLVTAHALALDYDGDGLDDVVAPKNSPATWHVARSVGSGFATLADLGLSWGGHHKAADFDGDGLGDIARNDLSNVWRYRRHEGTFPDLIDRVTDGFGNYVDFDYVPLTAGGPTYTKGSGAAFPTVDYQGPLYVVPSYTATNGIGGTYTMTQTYEQARFHLQGRGFLGFGKLKVTDSRNGIRNETTFLQDPLEYQAIGAPNLVQLRQSSGALIAETSNTWNKVSYGSGDTERRFPFVSPQVVKRWEAGGTYNGSLLGTATTTNVVDATSGTIYDSTTTTVEASTANGVQAGASYSARVYHSPAYLVNDTGNWCIGRPGRTELINSHTLYGGSSATRTASRTWDASKCRVTQAIAEPDSTQWKVTRDLGYDGWGNVNSDSITGIGMTARTTLAGWGSTGRFPESVTNALSQTTQFGWDATIGTLTSHTDPNGLISAWQHDGFGRRTREDRADSTATTWSYNDCPSYGCVNSNNKMLVIATELDTADVFVTDQWTYLDKLNRPIVASSRMLSGAYNRIDREYDALGRVHRESAPCWSAACALHWTTFMYDVLDRTTQVSRPTSGFDPTPATATAYFEGLTTRTLDPLGKQSTKVSNVLGNLARSADHDGYFQSFDYSGFGDAVRVTDSLSNTLQSIAYNVRGMKTAQTDIDMGAWEYLPNALGELERIRDAKTTAPAWTTIMGYDPLGRMTSRQDVPESVTASWTWGNSAAAKNIGRLESVSTPGYSEGFTYDSSGRPSVTTITADTTYQFAYAYNALGALDTLTYPSSAGGYRLKLQYDYQSGQLLRVKDFNAPTTVFWQANATDARGAVIDESLGNGLTTTRGFDSVTGLMDSIVTGPGSSGSIQDLGYSWDKLGNLTQRQDFNQSRTEVFFYDNLHRLDYSTLNGGTNLDLAYDGMGNISSKSGVGSYTYHATKKHAVIAAGASSFGYDANGNMAQRGTNTVEWYSFNKPKKINLAPGYSELFYGPDRQRIKQVDAAGNTLQYFGQQFEVLTSGALKTYLHHIFADGRAVARFTNYNFQGPDTRYLHRDHVGSVVATTDTAGTLQSRYEFDAFGVRSQTYGSGLYTQKGFTGHEHLDAVDLIDMGGRMQDPVLGRFISADPFVQAPDFTQSFNRYSYVFNSPLTFVDPSGFAAKVKRPEICIDSCGNGPWVTYSFSSFGAARPFVTIGTATFYRPDGTDARRPIAGPVPRSVGENDPPRDPRDVLGQPTRDPIQRNPYAELIDRVLEAAAQGETVTVKELFESLDDFGEIELQRLEDRGEARLAVTSVSDELAMGTFENTGQPGRIGRVGLAGTISGTFTVSREALRLSQIQGLRGYRIGLSRPIIAITIPRTGEYSYETGRDD